MKSIFYFIGILLIISCSSASIKEIEFPTTKYLTGHNVGPQNYFVNAEQILIDSSFILILDQKTKRIFHFLNNNFEIVNSIISLGKGPNEVLAAKLSQQMFMTNKSIIFYDNYQNVIGEINFNNKFDLDSLNKYKIPETIYDIQNILNLGKDNFVARGCHDVGKMAFFNKNNDSVIFTDFYPDFRIDKNNRDFFMEFNGEVSYNTINDLVVCSNRYFNQLELYSSEGEIVKEIKPEIVYNIFDYKDRYYFYNAVFTTDKYIYASYLNVNSKKLRPSFVNNIYSKIQVFDWNGNPVALYALDRLTGYFAVDKNDEFILCIDETNFERPLVKFDLR